MCGISGIIVGSGSSIDPKYFKRIFDTLFLLSQTRGKDASGIALMNEGEIDIYKDSVSASELIKSENYRKVFHDLMLSLSKEGKVINTIVAIGHTRMATNGIWESNDDNQPTIKSGLVGIHNGIVVNDGQIWNRFTELEREYEVDTEIILSLIEMFLEKNDSVTESVQNTFNLIEGAASIAVLFDNRNEIILATNTGSLYICENEERSLLIFASEMYILKKLIEKTAIDTKMGRFTIKQVRAGSGLAINVNNLEISEFNFKETGKEKRSEKIEARSIKDHSSYTEKYGSAVKSVELVRTSPNKPSNSAHERISEAVSNLKRCTKCILPETMPFIEFDEKGVCNYCRSYKRIDVKGDNALKDVAEKYRKKNGDPDCIVAFSGGRDSSYGLHYVKNVLRMNPIAYSYDWGMITDLGRRNQARMCGKLGVEHILISADIKKKRENIRKNVLSWLKRPDLGTVPLFMAGDKQYFYYAYKLMKNNNVDLLIMGENPLEKTGFKTAFSGGRQKNDGFMAYNVSRMNKLRMLLFYLKAFMSNPAYLNNSLLDTASAFISYYLLPHDYLNLYDYIKWDETIINNTLVTEYDWEVAKDSNSTWRIGDGTASFYNYIYYMFSGLTENDTFRSNQIREGVINRQLAIKIASDENKPRYDSMKWYCSTIGIDFDEAIKIIDNKAVSLNFKNWIK